MKIFDIRYARSRLRSLVERAAQGESFVIAKNGKPMVKVTPIEAPKLSMRGGFLEGQFSIPDDFDTMGCEEISRMFNGGN